MAYLDSFEPLLVRAHLRSAVVADRWLPLDGILFFQACREQEGAQEATRPGGGGIKSGGVSMPLKIIGYGTREWYYACSWAHWSHDVEGRDYWNKRFDSTYADLVDFGGRRGKVMVEKGQYKAYHMPMFYRAALWVEWYCVGDRMGIVQLLSTVAHIGKKAVQGWGRVARWEIDPMAEDWSIVRNGHLTRGVPKDHAQVLGVCYETMHYGIRPSYWKRGNQMVLAAPIG